MTNDLAHRLRERARWFDDVRFGQEIALLNEAADRIDFQEKCLAQAGETLLKLDKTNSELSERNITLSDREMASQAALARVKRIRDAYADQAKFADVDPASYFREFVRRLDAACMSPPSPRCYCAPGKCMAPVIMGRQTSCLDPEKAALSALEDSKGNLADANSNQKPLP